MNNLVKAAVAGSAVLGLAACGLGVGAGAGGPELPGSTVSGAVEGAASGAASGSGGAAPDVAVNERGFVVRQLGETACFGGAGKDCADGVSFALDQVEVDPPCTQFGSHPDNGHTVVLHLRVATGSDADAVDSVGGIINPFSFVEIGKDGVTRPTSFGMCVDPSANQLPDTYGPNQQYAGVIDLEVTEASGTIALQLTLPDEDGQRGWEWTYPV